MTSPSHNIRIGSYIDFVTRLLFWTGVSFETPLVVMFLARFRIVSAGKLIGWWRLRDRRRIRNRGGRDPDSWTR